MYFNTSAVVSMDAVLGYIASFIATLPGWTIDSAYASAVSGSLALTPVPGSKFIAHKGACLVGMRSTVNQGNTPSRLMLMDGIGPYTGGAEGSLNGNSGWGSLYTVPSLESGMGSPDQYMPDGVTPNPQYNVNFNAPPALIRGFEPYSTDVVNPGPYPNLYLFSNATGDYVHAVLQIDSLNFRHLMFGNLIQYGTWHNPSLGGYFAGSYWSNAGYAQVGVLPPISDPTSNAHSVPFQVGGSADGLGWDWTVSYANGRTGDTSKWLSPEPDTDNWNGSGVLRRQGTGSVRGGLNRLFKNIQISTFTGLVPMAPVIISSVNQNVSPNTICPVGEIPDFRMINMQNFSDGQEFAIGADTWKVFSMASKNGAFGQVTSAAAGFAYKKIP